ncbi:MAG TPA: endo-1,4-beta-xylanase, partial [Nocardioides sp.]
MKLRHIVVTVTAAATIAATASSVAQAEPRGFRPPSDSLRSYASQIGLHLGVAANPEVLADEELAGIAADEFSSITPENEMKWETVEPTRGTYDWSGADEVVEFARAHGQKVRGHTLLWHNQNPAWLTEGVNNGTISNDELRG